MEKGKKPIQEEEDFLSLLMDYHPNIVSTLPPVLLSAPTSEGARNPSHGCRLVSHENMVPNNTKTLSSTSMPAGSVSGPKSGLGAVGSGPILAEENIVALDEMDAAEGDFFSKFLTMNGTSAVPISSLSQSSMPPASNVAIAQDDDQVFAAQVSAEEIVPEEASKSATKEHRRAMPADVLANLALHDPKRAKRILTNRMSAVRAKEKKKLYTCMLEHRLQSLLSESTALTTRLNLMQRETKCLTTENAKLKQQTAMVVQRIHLQDSLNDEIRSEIKHLKMVAQMTTNRTVISNSISNGYLTKDAPAVGAEQFPDHPLAQNPYDQEQLLRQGLQQLNLGQNPYHVQYQQGQSGQLQQQQQQQHNLEVPLQPLQCPQVLQQAQPAVPCVMEPDTEQFNAGDRNNPYSLA